MSQRCLSCMHTIEGEHCPHCGYPAVTKNEGHHLPVGTMLRGRYQIGRVLGQGGFGITYLAWDVLMRGPVAVKEFYPGGTVYRKSTVSLRVECVTDSLIRQYEYNRERFLREASALVDFRDVPEVVGILDFVEENNTAYIVMEYVKGVDLAKYIQNRGGRLSVEETFRILRPVMEALAKVHQGGIVHRDISPDNIILDPVGGAKLLDFGAVRAVEDPDVEKGLNKSTEAILKHGFAPMEQYNTRGSLGPWTDEYAMCATVWYCLTGRIPEEASIRVMEGIDPDWSTVPGLPEHQQKALAKGISCRAKDRYPSMDALIEALFAESAAEPVPQPEPNPEPIPVPVPEAPAVPAFEPTVAIHTPPVQPEAPVQQPQIPMADPAGKDQRPKKKFWPILAAVAAVLVLAILAGILLPGMIAGNSNGNVHVPDRTEDSSTEKKEEPSEKDNTPGALPESDEIHIAVVLGTLASEYHNYIKDGCEKAAADLGIKVTVVGPGSVNDIEGQIGMIEQQIGAGCDAIICDPNDASGASAALQAAIDRGIPVIAVNRNIGMAGQTCFIGANQKEAAKEAGLWAAAKLGGSGNAVIIYGQEGDNTSNMRREGYEAACAEAGIEVLAALSGQNTTDGATKTMEDLLCVYLDQIDVVFCHNDDTAIGAMNACKSAGVEDIIIVGFDGNKSTVELILADGLVKATVAQQPYVMGYEAVMAAYKATNGEPVDAVIFAPAMVITIDNAQQYLASLN